MKRLTKQELDDFFDKVYANLPGEVKTLEEIIKEADESAKLMAQIDPLAHPMGEA